MNKKTRVKLLVSLGISFTLAGLIFLSLRTKFYQILELKALDLRFALKANRPSQSPILHIDIDDQSLSGIGRWPWPRNYHAKLTDILKECQAKQILMDIIFTEEFKDNPQEDALFADSMLRSRITYLPFYFIENQSIVRPELKALLLKDITLSAKDVAKTLKIPLETLKEELPQSKKIVLEEVTRKLMRKEPDISLEGVLRRIEEEYGWYLFPEDENYLRQRFPSQELLSLFITKFAINIPVTEWPFNQEYRMLNVPIMAFTQSMKGSGFINAEADLDGVTRRIPLFVKYEDKILPQLTIAALMDFLGVKELEASHNRVILKNANLAGVLKDIAIPVDKKGSMLINWQGRWGVAFKHLPYYLILRLQQVREQLYSKNTDNGAIEYLKKSETEL